MTDPAEYLHALTDFLMDARSYPEEPASIIRYETHISLVFVGDRIVYKIKKPVDFGFLDFTTLNKRRFYCTQEVTLNSRLAQGVYLGVVPIYRRGVGFTFSRAKGVRVVEYAVKMRRLDERKLLSREIIEGSLLYGQLNETGEILGRFHRSAPAHTRDSCGRIDIVRADTEENFEQIRGCLGATIDPESYDLLVSYTHDFLDRNKNIFARRKDGGWVRDGHGDLHSRHVCLTKPQVIFDCIEFNRRFRIADVLADIAFLLMDLEFRGRFDLSSALGRAYFSALPDACVPELLRFYKVYRAVVRGKIEGFTAEAMDDEASKRAASLRAINYYALARHYVEDRRMPFNPVVLMGVSGAGKSVIARDLLPGALVLRSDEVRKGIAGIDAHTHVLTEYGSGIYATDMSDRVYEALTEQSVSAAGTGERVVVDATFLKSYQRSMLYRASVKAGLNPFFIHCSASADVLRERVKVRQDAGIDVSDAGIAVLERQLGTAEDPVELPFFRVMKLNTSRESVEAIKRSLRQFL
jgi:aminoglycoside phosphotransferase family enzyme/predicted kinase